MKHISAYMGLSKKQCQLKRSLIPRRSSSGTWIMPLEQYYLVTQTWAPAISKDGNISNTRILTKYEFILEEFTKNST